MHAPVSLPQPIRDLAEEALGAPPTVVGELTRPGSEATALRLAGRDRVAILKLQPNGAKHAREREAYRRWLPAHPGPAAALLAVRDEAPRAILLEDLPGRADPAPGAPGSERVHEAAGAWLAALHALPYPDDDAVPPEEAYARRAESWLARAEGAAPAPLLSAARERIAEAVRDLHGVRRVPCHRDFAPYNWMASGPRLFGVVDFEHARPDVAAADLVRAWAYDDEGHDRLRRAFLAGYASVAGRATPDPPVGLRLLDAVGTLAWAARHGDEVAMAAARRATERLLRGADGPARAGG